MEKNTIVFPSKEEVQRAYPHYVGANNDIQEKNDEYRRFNPHIKNYIKNLKNSAEKSFIINRLKYLFAESDRNFDDVNAYGYNDTQAILSKFSTHYNQMDNAEKSIVDVASFNNVKSLFFKCCLLKYSFLPQNEISTDMSNLQFFTNYGLVTRFRMVHRDIIMINFLSYKDYNKTREELFVDRVSDNLKTKEYPIYDKGVQSTTFTENKKLRLDLDPTVILSCKKY